jgi:hypothetical protein
MPLVCILGLAACGQPQFSHPDELDASPVFGVPLESPAAIQRGFRAANVPLDKDATDRILAGEGWVWRGIPDEAMALHVDRTAVELKDGRLVGMELTYDPHLMGMVCHILVQRWGPGVNRGPLGVRWQGEKYLADLLPATSRRPWVRLRIRPVFDPTQTIRRFETPADGPNPFDRRN